MLNEAIQKLAIAVARLPIDTRYAPTKPRALVVGGFVRDRLLGIESTDVDVEVYGVGADVLEKLLRELFGEVNLVGESFGIMKVPLGDGFDLDVALPRQEAKRGAGHRGFSVEVDPGLPMVQAARRRDFTINTLLLDPLTDEIIDPFGGAEDLRQGVLRIVDVQTFGEDPLRVLRAMQLAARFDLQLDDQSVALMRGMVERGDLAELSAERITGELEKLLLSACPSRGFNVGRELGVIETLFPELAATIGVPQEPQWHPEGDVWVHTLMVVDEAARIVRRDEMSDRMRLQIMLGALCHDFGKPLVTRMIDGRVRALGHEAAGEEPTREFCKRLYFHHEVEQAAVMAAMEHLKPGLLYRAREKGEMSAAQYVRGTARVMRRIAPTPWQVLAAVSEADMRGRGLPGMTEAEKDVAAYPGQLFAQTIVEHDLATTALEPLLFGRDLLELGYEPGPEMGEILARIATARDEGFVNTRVEALALVQSLLAK